ncbi:MAG: glutamine-hydrolyzing carbamoyl-phosphate synthase small subunit [Syntrophorhabdaceae bacterium]|nr:glutamine-hydrolyzing carbamoyl-phosphate synthase small subunit [Syntrophorhabdaceae bacterium]
MKKKRAMIALEDGRVFEGLSCGVEGEREGEIVFNTSMMGYQEIITDPSYKGQIVTMTYPLIGNYGVNSTDVESSSPKVEGFILREMSTITSNHRAEAHLVDYFREYGIVAVEGVDTRALTKHIRLRGAMKGVISTIDLDPKSLVEKAKNSPGIVGRDLVREVTCKEGYLFEVEGERVAPERNSDRLNVVVMDYGVKLNILRILHNIGCRVHVVPAHTKADTVLSMKPDGVLLSNGPGDPEGLPYAVSEIRHLLGKVPLFGICLGQQLLGLAYGGKTYKLKFGHRGANQPIKELSTGNVYIASENHGFAVDLASIKEEPVVPTHINLNDNTVEGIEHKKFPAFSVQYHPEASPGPHDSYGLFTKFKKMMEDFKKRTYA